MNWWLIIRTPDAVHCWPVWDEDDEPDEALINAARVTVGFPASDQWRAGYDIQLTLGEPHPTLRAVVGTDLRLVDPAAVAEHVTNRRTDAHERHVAAVTETLAGLPPEVLAAVLSHPDLAEHVSAVHKGG